MPSSSGQADREEPGAAKKEGPGEEARDEGISDVSTKTIECPICGHDFTGTYCLEYGQQADSPVSTIDVGGGFFRECADVERGLLADFSQAHPPGTTLPGYCGLLQGKGV